MSKVKPQILGGVNLGTGTVFVEGMEDQLGEVISQDQIDHLTEQGAITGDWVVKKSTAQAKREASEAEAEAKDKADAEAAKNAK